MSSSNQKLEQLKKFLKASDKETLKIYLQDLDLKLISESELLALADYLTLNSLLPDARIIWQEIVKRLPEVAEVRNNLGLVLFSINELDAAKRELLKATELKNDFPQAYFNLGKTLLKLRDFEKAEDAFLKAEKFGLSNPEFFKAYCSALFARHQYFRALSVLKNAINKYSDNQDIRRLLAIALYKTYQYEEAVKILKELINNSGKNAELYNLLGLCLVKTGYLAESQNYFLKASEDKKFKMIARANLANCLIQQGLTSEGISELSKILLAEPDNKDYKGMLCVSTNYDQNLSIAQIKSIHDSFNNCFNKAPVIKNKKHSKIRVAYLSADFKLHSVAYFMKALFEYRDREKFEITVCSDAGFLDNTGKWFKSKTDRWLDTSSVSHTDLIKELRKQEINIAFDLAGHTDGNRLTCFAERVAPVQISYLGYPNTTGLAAMDFKITDSYCDPEGAEEFYSEKLLRLDPSFLCYSTLNNPPEVSEPAFKVNNYISFGSFNSVAKINSEVLKSWCAILNSVPDSRLVLKARCFRDPLCKNRIISVFEKSGISGERLILIPHTSEWTEHMKLYSKIDIALDTFPYNGTTTTFEALLMGVPTVCIAGDRHSARTAHSILSNLGLRKLIAKDIDTYIRIAVELAKDMSSLQDYRLRIPSLLRSSELMNAKNFTIKFENLISQLI